jgi:hypothetical protein
LPFASSGLLMFYGSGNVRRVIGLNHELEHGFDELVEALSPGMSSPSVPHRARTV